MPWANQDPDKRRRDAQVYRDPEYKRNRKIALSRAGGRCEQCGRRGRLEVDHVVPIAVRIDHSLGNLTVLCAGPSSCHATKTAHDSHVTGRQQRDPAFTTSRTQW